jgi:lariat debranching enzyme
MRSIYHVRSCDVQRLKHIRQPMDIFLSHDWPRGIWDYGDRDLLLRHKQYFQSDSASHHPKIPHLAPDLLPVSVDQGLLGSLPASELLHQLRPSMWFSAHLHCKFSAVVPHPADESCACMAFVTTDSL